MYLIIENDKIIGGNVYNDPAYTTVEVTDEVGDYILANRQRYIYKDGYIIENPDYIKLKEAEFDKDFFLTSLGYIRRKVTMKTGEIKDFLTDLLPTIVLGVQSGTPVQIIAYTKPDLSQEEVDWESLQSIVTATPEFIRECYLQLSRDFTG